MTWDSTVLFWHKSNLAASCLLLRLLFPVTFADSHDAVLEGLQTSCTCLTWSPVTFDAGRQPHAPSILAPWRDWGTQTVLCYGESKVPQQHHTYIYPRFLCFFGWQWFRCVHLSWGCFRWVLSQEMGLDLDVVNPFSWAVPFFSLSCNMFVILWH